MKFFGGDFEREIWVGRGWVLEKEDN